MKKFIISTLILYLAVFSFTACGKKEAPPVAGSSGAEDMLNLVPEDAIGVIMIDANRAMNTDMARKAIQESDEYEKYQEFITATGIDPQKDIHFVTIALSGSLNEKDTQGGGIINMKYDKDKLLELMKEKSAEEGKDYTEEVYEGMTLYSWKEDDGDMSVSFLDDSNLLAGNTPAVKSIIDVAKKKKGNISQNKALSDMIAAANTKAMMWGGVMISPEALEAMKSGNPMLGDFDGISGISMFFDTTADKVLAEIKLMNSDSEKNKQISEMLTGFKAMGGMAAAERPEVGELLDGITISSGADHVKLSVDIAQDLIAKLTAKEQEEEEEIN